MYKNEILNAIDDINLITSECEYDTINEMYNSYNKASMILENYDGDKLDAFNVFNDTNEFYQESVSDKMKQSGAKYGTLMKIITFIPRLIKALFQTIIEKFKKVDKNKTKIDTSNIKKAPKEIKQKLAEAFDFSNPKKKRIAILSSIIGGTALVGGGVALGVHHHNKKKNDGDVIDDKPVVNETENENVSVQDNITDNKSLNDDDEITTPPSKPRVTPTSSTPKNPSPTPVKSSENVEKVAEKIIDAVDQMNQEVKKQTEQINKRISYATTSTNSPIEGKITYDIDKGIFVIDYVDLEGLQNIILYYMQNVINTVKDIEKYNKDKSSRNTVEKKLQSQLDKDNYGRTIDEKGEIQYPESIVKALKRPVAVPITSEEFDKQTKLFIEKNRKINDLNDDYNKAIETLNANSFKFVPSDIEAYIRRLHEYIKEISDAIRIYSDMLVKLFNDSKFVYEHINNALNENIHDPDITAAKFDQSILPNGIAKDEYLFVNRFANKVDKNVSILGFGDIKYTYQHAPECDNTLITIANILDDTLMNNDNGIYNPSRELDRIFKSIDLTIRKITNKSSDKATYQKISKFLKAVGFNEESVNRAKIMEDASLKKMFNKKYVHIDDLSRENQVQSVLMNPHKLRIPKELFVDKNNDYVIRGACSVYSNI